jgi:hypothetical protein
VYDTKKWVLERCVPLDALLRLTKANGLRIDADWSRCTPEHTIRERGGMTPELTI